MDAKQLAPIGALVAILLAVAYFFLFPHPPISTGEQLIWGGYWGYNYMHETDSYVTLANSTTMFAVKFVSPESVTVNSTWLLAYDTHDAAWLVGLQGDSAGAPSGTWLGATANGFINSSDCNVYWCGGTLGEQVTLTAGTTYWAVLKAGAAHYSIRAYSVTNATGQNLEDIFVYNMTNQSIATYQTLNGVAWTKINGKGGPFYIMRASGVNFGNPIHHGAYVVNSTRLWGQTFVTDDNLNVSRAEFAIRAYGSPACDLQVHIISGYGSSGWSAGSLGNCSIPNADLTSASAAVVGCTLTSNALLENDTRYTTFVRDLNGTCDNSNFYYVSVSENQAGDASFGGNSTSTGSFTVYSSDNGTAWVNSTGLDTPFRFNYTLYTPSPPTDFPDTSPAIWNGTAWIDFNTSNNLSIAGCGAPSTYCEPRNQNASTGQAIFNISNNGTAAGATLVAWLNATKTWTNLTCSDYNSTASGLVTIGASASALNSTSTAVSGWHDIFCWFNISATPGADRAWTLTFNYTA